MSRIARSAMIGTLFLIGAAAAAAAQPAEPVGRSGTSLRNAQGQVVGNAGAARQGQAEKV